MIPELYAKSKKFMGVGIVVSVAAQAATHLLGSVPVVGTVLGFVSLGGFAAYMYGCGEYAKAKGREGYVGLLGFFFPFGLAILIWYVEDKSAQLPPAAAI